MKNKSNKDIRDILIKYLYPKIVAKKREDKQFETIATEIMISSLGIPKQLDNIVKELDALFTQALEQKEREIVEHIEYGKPLSSFIQWKGTDVCLDWFCEKGHQNHTDGDFVYEVICEFCKAKYKTGTSIILSNLKSEGK